MTGLTFSDNKNFIYREEKYVSTGCTSCVRRSTKCQHWKILYVDFVSIFESYIVKSQQTVPSFFSKAKLLKAKYIIYNRAL